MKIPVFKINALARDEPLQRQPISQLQSRAGSCSGSGMVITYNSREKSGKRAGGWPFLFINAARAAIHSAPLNVSRGRVRVPLSFSLPEYGKNAQGALSKNSRTPASEAPLVAWHQKRGRKYTGHMPVCEAACGLLGERDGQGVGTRRAVIERGEEGLVIAWVVIVPNCHFFYGVVKIIEQRGTSVYCNKRFESVYRWHLVRACARARRAA